MDQRPIDPAAFRRLMRRGTRIERDGDKLVMSERPRVLNTSQEEQRRARQVVKRQENIARRERAAERERAAR